MPSERWLQLKAPSGTCPRREPACSQMLWGRALTLLFSCGGPGWCLLPTEGRSICLGNLLDGAAAFMGPLSGASGHLLRLPHQLLRPHLHSDAVETLLSWSLRASLCRPQTFSCSFLPSCSLCCLAEPGPCLR